MATYSAAEKAIVWLCANGGLDNGERVALLRAAKNPANLFADWENISRSVIKTEKLGVYNNDGASLLREAEGYLAKLERAGYFAVTLVSEDYPSELKQIPQPPLALFGAGNRALLTKRKFCIVGSRVTPPWAEKQAKEISRALSEQFAVVTGFAEGGDRAAIDGAIGSGNLICVLPLGLNGCYPVSHASLKEQVKKSGLLLSEYPPDEQLRKYNFHARNRILAGLAEGALVVSAKARNSGALITANYATEYNKDVFAFPYNLGAAQGTGCNELIKQGAYLVTEAEDILSCYGMKGTQKQQIELSSTEEKVLAVLREAGEEHAAVIASRAEIPLYEALAALSSLELKGLAVKAGGNRYQAL